MAKTRRSPYSLYISPLVHHFKLNGWPIAAFLGFITAATIGASMIAERYSFSNIAFEDAIVTQTTEARDNANTARENEVFDLINKERTSRDRNALAMSDQLTFCSEPHSISMSRKESIFHNKNLGDCAASGWTVLGENVGIGPVPSSQEKRNDIVEAWMGSEDHRANILYSGYNCIGVAMIERDNVEYWTTAFGKYPDGCKGIKDTLANTSFESSTIVSGVKWNDVTERAVWHTWAPGDGQAYRGKSCCAYDGDYVISMKDTTSSGVSTTQVVRGYAGAKYNLTAHSLWFEGNRQQYLYLDFLDSNYNRVSDPKVVSAPTRRCSGNSTGWCAVTTGNVTSPSRTYYVRIILYGSKAGLSKYYWDKVSLTRN